MPEIIKLTQISKHFGQTVALEGVDFTVEKGEVVGFIGANGAGKTTTISLMLGFIRSTAGQVEVLGQTVTPQSAHELHIRIGYAAGDMELPPKLTGRQYLNFVAHQSGDNHSKRLAELTKIFQPDLDKKFNNLSRGNKQKIALVAAFMTSPELVILDEPTSGLDPIMQEAFLDLVRQSQRTGATIFMSSHYLAEVADVCSRVILMKSGKVVRDLPTKELLANGAKQIRISTGYLATKPPKSASKIEASKTKGYLELAFTYNGSLTELQIWLSGVRQLKDIEISDNGLDSLLDTFYSEEESKV